MSFYCDRPFFKNLLRNGRRYKIIFLHHRRRVITMDSLRKVLADGIRTESSTEQYLKGIQLLWNMVFEDKMPEDPLWIKSKAQKIVAAVLERYDKTGSRRTRLAPFLAICRKLGYAEAYQTYYEPFRKENKALKESAQRKIETKTSDATSEMTVEEVETFGKKLARKVRQLSLEDTNRDFTPKKVKIIMWHLVLEWHVLLGREHRRRVKVHELPILQKGQRIEGASYLLQTSRRKGDYKLVLEDGDRIPLSKMLSKYLHRTLWLIPRYYFLTSITQPQTAMSASNWSMFISNIQYNGKRFNPDRL
jgi:hypothetical protein